jgi:hypothetical protein
MLSEMRAPKVLIHDHFVYPKLCTVPMKSVTYNSLSHQAYTG